MKKNILKLAFLFVYSLSFGQTNLLDTTTWTEGNTPARGFEITGENYENIREMGIDPYGGASVLWKVIPSSTYRGRGGLKASLLGIDPSKTYRFTIWVKKTGSMNGRTFFGTQTRDDYGKATLSLEGNFVKNPYFWQGELPELDKWYLLVGYIHESNYQGTKNLGGIYDGVTGVKVLDMENDFKFRQGADKLKHKALFEYGRNIYDRQFFWDPRVEVVNGQEPTVQKLLAGTPDPIEGSGMWTPSGLDIKFTTGNVGIGTAAQNAYRLAVDGKIHTKEVKVDLTGWADYVFKTDYDLPTLREVEAHIEEKGHLINIPSAGEVEANGIQLGEMNRLLLEKIEELTLYILEQERRIQVLEGKQ
ncbi:hypothetical protein [Spongiimicrobium sp. 3-5]|uniref:hypothetical protein n=1 Tax=Spongiimicrobium sp. 3-5 TaxID=3332596 RepID=UPI00397FAF6E